MQQAQDPKKRQPLQAREVVARDPVRDLQDIANLLGLHRHSVAVGGRPMPQVVWPRCSATRSRALPAARASRPRR